MNEPNVLVLFTCFNRKDKTINAINSIKNQYSNVEFLIVDDNSTDGTVDEINRIENIKKEIIITNGNKYYSASMRIGMEHLLKSGKKHDYLMIINDDVEFDNDFMHDYIQYSQDNNCIVIGPTCNDNNELSYGGYIYHKWYKATSTIVGPDYRGECSTFNGNCVLIPYECFIKAGPMDKRYTHYIGDTDYGHCMRKLGYKLLMFNRYVGHCNRNSKKGTWVDNNLSRLERLRLKSTPKGYRFGEYFHYYFKNFNLYLAIKESIKPYYLILFKK